MPGYVQQLWNERVSSQRWRWLPHPSWFTTKERAPWRCGA